MMFDKSPKNDEFEVSSNENPIEASDIELIIQECLEIPDIVRFATIDKTFQRLMNKDELERVTTPRPIGTATVDSEDRLAKRRKVLQRYLGAHLTCAIVRLPGLYYTMEIDIDTSSVVHWEWQEFQ